MKFLDFLASAGTGVLNIVAPGMGTAAAALINPFLDDDKKINPDTATKDDILAGIEKLPPAEQAKVYNAKVDLEKQVIIADMNESDNFYANQKILADLEKAGSKVRPIAVYTSLLCMVFAIATAMLSHILPAYMWATACFEVVDAEGSMAAALALPTCDITKMPQIDATFIFAILALPTWIIQTYMGKRSKEKEARRNAAMGVPTVDTSFMTKIAGKLFK